MKDDGFFGMDGCPEGHSSAAKTPEELNVELSAAAVNGETDVVASLLDRGADIHTGGDWPLRIAAANGHKEAVILLLDRGADMHAQGNQVFHWSALNGHADIVDMLLARGMNLHANNNEAIGLVAQVGQMGAVNMLLDLVDWSSEARVAALRWDLLKSSQLVVVAAIDARILRAQIEEKLLTAAANQIRKHALSRL